MFSGRQVFVTRRFAGEGPWSLLYPGLRRETWGTRFCSGVRCGPPAALSTVTDLVDTAGETETTEKARLAIEKRTFQTLVTFAPMQTPRSWYQAA